MLIAADTGEPVFLPFRMSCFVLSNLVVTAGMLTPGLGVCSSFYSSKLKTESMADYWHTPLANHQPIS
jgi:hypothetical protein